MIIKKLEVKGPGKETAHLDFEKGLNVIAGASDTGKSYITKCFQFIFGTEQPPKPIDQSEGYTHVEVTFETEDGFEFLLSRELAEKSDITLIELDKNNLTTVLKPGHMGKNNLSSFFLEKLGLNNQILVKGVENMTHSSLTLRVLEKVFLVDEERIISENSPFGKGQNNEKTLETSFVKTLLTGEDDSSILECRENKLSKETIKRKINSLEEFLEQFFPENDDDENTLAKLDSALEELEEQYDEAEEELNTLINSNSTLVNKRNELKAQASRLYMEIADDETLSQRFVLLDSKYKSDLERLEANSEATIYMNQQQQVSCPICGSEMEDDDMDIESILEANASDIKKIKTHLADLSSTQDSLTQSLEKNKNDLNKIEHDISNLDKTLELKIGVKLTENKELLKRLDQARTNFRKQRDQEKKRDEILLEIGRLEVDHDLITDNYQIKDFDDEAFKLSKEISKILKRWDFPNWDNVEFDIATRDIKIGGKHRSHFGKGYRAISLSAVLLGLMQQLSKSGRHPGFLILDSPLTTYRKQDEAKEKDNEEVYLAHNLIYAFYRDLCDFYNDKQVIVLDNQEPGQDLYNSMNYIHFSGNSDVGRKGFFPA